LRRDTWPSFIVCAGLALISFFVGMAFTHWCMVNGYMV